ncbi:hypothetical protein C5E45_20040 [Nocardia nova]|uniref:Uncharacterized protein n=1 Tax=Nocardia nova TaxID=37330 RepID=A0A2S6AM81_9NOCA|nr:hypothetical protein C5E45_20040 [Nocardia nova]
MDSGIERTSAAAVSAGSGSGLTFSSETAAAAVMARADSDRPQMVHVVGGTDGEHGFGAEVEARE